MKASARIPTLLAPALALALAGCAKKADPAASCAQTGLASGAGSTGQARVFASDPISASGNPNLSPSSRQLDSLAVPVQLQRLGGQGVLEGQYVDIRNGQSCNEGFGAQDAENRFSYAHPDPRFQEAMAYYHGDSYRAALDELGYLSPPTPVRIVAHCELDDNSYYTRSLNADGTINEHVCLGDSVATPGASYADDAEVIVHELQHATTMDSYSSQYDLGSFKYDEGGAISEAVSDFMGLLEFEPGIAGGLDARVFSRWALGTFIPGTSGVRGANLCPAYDSAYPDCASYPAFSGASNTVSYVYPDGLGWPYADDFKGPGYVSSAFKLYPHQAEIHNAGVLLVGALWDVYEAVRAAHGGDASAARTLVRQALLEAIRHLPKPTVAHQAPVIFRGLAQWLIDAAALLALPAADQSAIAQALANRGLVGGVTLDAGWAAVGPGVGANPGLRIEDDPNVLRGWLSAEGADPTVVTQGFATGLNGRLDPGETVALWFDIEDLEAATAGGVEVTVTSVDPEVSFLDGSVNWGPISETQAQAFYQKINGTAIVSALGTGGSSYAVVTGNSFFQTDPFFGQDARSAIWARVNANAAHGKVVTFSVTAAPSNGAASTVNFTATIH